MVQYFHLPIDLVQTQPTVPLYVLSDIFFHIISSLNFACPRFIFFVIEAICDTLLCRRTSLVYLLIHVEALASPIPLLLLWKH